MKYGETYKGAPPPAASATREMELELAPKTQSALPPEEQIDRAPAAVPEPNAEPKSFDMREESPARASDQLLRYEPYSRMR